MAIIPLTKGKFTEVDDDLFEALSKFKWYAQGPDFRPARRITFPRHTILLMYYQILEIYPWELRVDQVIDHIDRNPLNNKKANLRIVTYSENMQNTLRHANRVGIGRDNRHDRYKAYLDQPGKNRINIGTYKAREEAEQALLSFKENFYGLPLSPTDQEV